jgi:hypothetical protein
MSVSLLKNLKNDWKMIAGLHLYLYVVHD